MNPFVSITEDLPTFSLLERFMVISYVQQDQKTVNMWIKLEWNSFAIGIEQWKITYLQESTLVEGCVEGYIPSEHMD